ncbi:MAG: hypothetical protein ACOX0Z_00655 [Candidatus Nanosyncoccaceae bacterium]
MHETKNINFKEAVAEGWTAFFASTSWQFVLRYVTSSGSQCYGN